jgi:hypothetical protein
MKYLFKRLYVIYLAIVALIYLSFFIGGFSEKFKYKKYQESLIRETVIEILYEKGLIE